MTTADLIKIEMKRRRSASGSVTTDNIAEAVGAIIDRRNAELESRMKAMLREPDE